MDEIVLALVHRIIALDKPTRDKTLSNLVLLLTVDSELKLARSLQGGIWNDLSRIHELMGMVLFEASPQGTKTRLNLGLSPLGMDDIIRTIPALLN